VSALGPILRRLLRCLGAGLALSCGAATFAAEPAASPEYQLKAVYLFNFAQFTQWPPNAFESRDAPFVIGILGNDPFAGALEEAVKGETIAGHSISIRHFARPEEAQACHILFVDAAARANLDRFLAIAKARPILTVSDIPGFARRGGTIGFYFDGAKLRFEINQAEAQRNGLQLSSQLLKLARIVSAAP
jgi:hypothetical protein